MTVAPLIAMKSTKCESLEAVGKELDRRAHTYANDVDQSGRHVGYLCRAGDESPVPLEQAIERRMGELNTTSPMGIRYPIPIRRGGLEGFHPSISAEPSYGNRK